MYRSSAHYPIGPGHLLSPGSMDDEELDERSLLERLEKKRRELDEEIAAFKAKKDKEFRTFEKNLRKHRSSSSSSKSKDVGEPSSPDSSTKSEAKLSKDGNGTLDCAPNHDAAKESVTWRSASAESSRERALSQHLRGLESNGVNEEHNHRGLAQPEATTPTAYERERDFHGLFTPKYLPLLSTQREKSTRDDVQGSNTSVSRRNTKDSNETVRVLNNEAALPLASTTSISTPPSSSLPPTRETTRWSNPIVRPRSQTTSPHASTSLPSALRSSHANKQRTPKQVHFQLENGTARPSSPYEERRTTTNTDMPTIYGSWELPASDDESDLDQRTMEDPKNDETRMNWAAQIPNKPKKPNPEPAKASSTSKISLFELGEPAYPSKTSSPSSVQPRPSPAKTAADKAVKTTSEADNEPFLFDEDLALEEQEHKAAKEKAKKEEEAEAEEQEAEDEGEVVTSYSGSVPIAIMDPRKGPRRS